MEAQLEDESRLQNENNKLTADLAAQRQLVRTLEGNSDVVVRLKYELELNKNKTMEDKRCFCYSADLLLLLSHYCRYCHLTTAAAAISLLLPLPSHYCRCHLTTAATAISLLPLLPSHYCRYCHLTAAATAISLLLPSHYCRFCSCRNAAAADAPITSHCWYSFNCTDHLLTLLLLITF